jgi:hypothetical protein
MMMTEQNKNSVFVMNIAKNSINTTTRNSSSLTNTTRRAVFILSITFVEQTCVRSTLTKKSWIVRHPTSYPLPSPLICSRRNQSIFIWLWIIKHNIIIIQYNNCEAERNAIQYKAVVVMFRSSRLQCLLWLFKIFKTIHFHWHNNKYSIQTNKRLSCCLCFAFWVNWYLKKDHTNFPFDSKSLVYCSCCRRCCCFTSV